MPLVQNLQKLAARLNTLPSKFGVEMYKAVMVQYVNSQNIALTVPLMPNPHVDLVKPQQIGRFLTASVEVFQGDIVITEIARYQELIEPTNPAATVNILAKAKYLLGGKVYFCTHLDTSDTVFLTAYIREDRLSR
jgi:hypothetical protein